MAKKAVGESVVEREALRGMDKTVKENPLGRFSCGHVGKEIGEKARAFIMWVEVRNYRVSDVPNKCPSCK